MLLLVAEPTVSTPVRRYAFIYWLATSYLLLNLISRLGLTWMSWDRGSLSLLDLLYAYGVGWLLPIGWLKLFLCVTERL